MSHIITLIASVASHPVPDYILENLSELAGTLIASLLIAIVTTYVFSRRQEVQKVRARILHYRLEQYAQIIQCLGRYSDQHSWEGMIREQVLDVLEQAGLPLGNEDLIAPSVLTNESESICLLKELETLSIKGLYILDNDVLEKLLEVKIYLMNYHMFADLIEGYSKSNIDLFPEKACKNVKETFFQYYSLVIAKEFDDIVTSLEETIQQKQSTLKFERSGKNYRNVRRRKKIINKLLEKSILCGNTVNTFHLIGLILGTEMGWEDADAANGIMDWMSYVQGIISFQL